MRIRRLLIPGVVLLLAGFISTLTSAWADGTPAVSPAAYIGLVFTSAGFIFAAGAWVGSVRSIGARSLAHQRTLYGTDGCSGLTRDVRVIQDQVQHFVTDADLLTSQQEWLDRFERRCAAHAHDWREELERGRRESEKRMDEQTKRIDSALATMQAVVKTLGRMGLDTE